MENPSEGDQINDQTVPPSADEEKKKRKRASDQKYRDKKKQKTENTERELERFKVKCAEMEKCNAYVTGMLYQSQKNLEQTREANRQLQQIVDRQTITINMFQQQQLTGNSGGRPVLAHENQPGNSGELPVIPHEEPFLNVDYLLTDDREEMPVMK